MHGTIKSSTEVSEIFSKGERIDTAFITLLVSPRRGPQGRVAFVAGKRNGCAVWRNSAKRRMREVCRQLGGPWPDYDVVFLAKRRIMKPAYSKVLQACKKGVVALDKGSI
ncbi:MAG: ribonuclease P protein component [Coriobacteriia bacterium]|nr:ribonuclease P protein component [Coriobacteriia bacterium]